MTVYVDAPRTYTGQDDKTIAAGQKHGHLWCHMWADDIDELHAVAEAIGLKRRWFQNDTRLPHYDLTPPRRRRAIKHGAIESSVRAWTRMKQTEYRED